VSHREPATTDTDETRQQNGSRDVHDGSAVLVLLLARALTLLIFVVTACATRRRPRPERFRPGQGGGGVGRWWSVGADGVEPAAPSTSLTQLTCSS
jgi:hypothetical protein